MSNAEGSLAFALRAALAAALAALPMTLTGRPDLAVYGVLGAFTTTFGRNLPYARRARVLALVALAITASVGCGSVLAALARPWEGGGGALVVVAATAVVAGVAKFACDAARLGGLGAILLLFGFAVAANDPAAPGAVLPHTAVAAIGAAAAWGLGVAGRLVHPDRPQRLAVAGALRGVAEVLAAGGGGGGAGSGTGAGAGGGAGGRTGAAGDDAKAADDPPAPTTRARYRATAAVLQAYFTLGRTPAPPSPSRTGADREPCTYLTNLSWALLIHSARRAPRTLTALARPMRAQADLLTGRHRRPPPVLRELAPPPLPVRQHAPPSPEPAARPFPLGSAAPTAPARRRAWELVAAHRRGKRLEVLAVPALRMTLGTALAGTAAVALHLGHGYWAAISAAAVLHSVNVRTTSVRSLQRALGTIAGLALTLAVLSLHPGATALALVIVLLEFLLELSVVRNYALGVVFVTSLALLLTDLGEPVAPGRLIEDRALGSLLGITTGLACALLVTHHHASLRVERALVACTHALQHAEHALAAPGPVPPDLSVQLAVSAVELREADDAAAGELHSPKVDPTRLAATERRAYALLERLLERG
ncbi:FUSC family protein [Streptomyces polyrhachis]|uniref:FUSC family protein n=1 Tax=Streptomyces polyrhachis TaxID=1282885 RepID=A0ABW2GLJ6_9ACTN